MNKIIAHNIPQQVLIRQTAYQEARTTTELIYTFRTLAEKAIISQNHDVYLIMLDTSKVFDMAQRNTIYKDQADVREPDLLMMMYSILRNVIL